MMLEKKAHGSRLKSEPKRIGEVLPDFFAQNPKLAAKLADYRSQSLNVQEGMPYEK